MDLVCFSFPPKGQYWKLIVQLSTGIQEPTAQHTYLSTHLSSLRWQLEVPIQKRISKGRSFVEGLIAVAEYVSIVYVLGKTEMQFN